MQTLSIVIAAFFLYLLVLPLLGLVVGFCARVLAPYLLCAGLILWLGVSQYWLLAGIWGLLLLAVRVWLTNGRRLQWHEGHYQAVGALLTVGPLRTGSRLTGPLR